MGGDGLFYFCNIDLQEAFLQVRRYLAYNVPFRELTYAADPDVLQEEERLVL